MRQAHIGLNIKYPVTCTRVVIFIVEFFSIDGLWVKLDSENAIIGEVSSVVTCNSYQGNIWALLHLVVCIHTCVFLF